MLRGSGVVLVVALAGIVACGSAAVQRNESATEVVAAFYQFHFQNDMGFTRETVDRRARWLAPELRKAIAGYFARPRPADEVPPINGDPFTNTQEYPQSFNVVGSRLTVTGAEVDVAFAVGPEVRSVTVVLVHDGGEWRIADLRANGGPTFRAILEM